MVRFANKIVACSKGMYVKFMSVAMDMNSLCVEIVRRPYRAGRNDTANCVCDT